MLIKRIQRRFKNPILIQETAESFIYKIKEYISTCPTKIQFNTYDKWNLKQIRKQDYNVESYLKPDLYIGAEPTWEDIFSNHDVVWEKTRQVIEDFKKKIIIFVH